jgi:hypothetical protein
MFNSIMFVMQNTNKDISLRTFWYTNNKKINEKECIHVTICNKAKGSSWPWSYGSWIYNFLCNQCLSPLMLWVRISIRARCTTLCHKVCQWLATGWCFSSGPQVSSTNKTDRHDITEILLKVALSTINTKPSNFLLF